MAFKGLRFAGLEMKNSTASAAMKVVLVAIGIIPLLYGALYLYAFLDPYVQLNTVPVAVVNEDAGAMVAGQQRVVGNDVVDALKDNHDGLGWHFVSAEAAQPGMENGSYYMTATIPADFSQNIASADSDDPRHAQLLINYDQSKNMLASQIGATVWDKVRLQVSDTVAKQYWDTVLNSTNDAGTSLKTASEGAHDLQVGMTSAQEGATLITEKLTTLSGGSATLKDGTAALLAGTQTLKAGAGDLNQGAATAASGAQQLQREGTSQVAAGAAGLVQATAALPDAAQVAQLGAASDKLKSGFAAANAGMGSAGDTGATTLQGGLNQLRAGVGAADDAAPTTLYGLLNAASAEQAAGDAALAADDAAAAQAHFATAHQLTAAALQATGKLSSGLATQQAGLTQVATGVAQLSTGFATLTDLTAPLVSGAPPLKAAIAQLGAGAAHVDANMGALVAGTGSLASGANQLAAGTASAAAGAAQLDGGATQIASGAPQLRAGAQALADGLQPATAGSGQLSDQLAQGASALTLTQADIAAKSEVMSDPVQLTSEYYTTVENYGTGFAPYFMALGLWVGALVASFAFKPLNKRLIISGGNPFMVAFATYLPLAGIALVQALLLLACLQFGLQLQIDNVALYYAFGLLTALVFAAIMQFLMAAFAFPGRFIAIILLMLQLTSAAGTFPIETTPAFFQVVSPYMPMTYVVAGMREIMTGIDLSVAGTDAAMLLLFGVVSFGLTAWVAYRKRMVRMEDLHPLLHLG
ncbi:MAG: YhgE/Pip domain-containing protein [Raoultibacter sp.]